MFVFDGLNSGLSKLLYLMRCVFWHEGNKNINIQAIMFQGVPYPGLQKRDKPRRVELYFSSWVIRAGKC